MIIINNNGRIMKRFLMLSLFFILTQSIFSQQLLQQFKASQGLQSAMNLAKDSGMVKPVLVSIGTMSRALPIGTMTVPIEFDEDKGTSTAWAYVVKDLENPDNIRIIGVIRMFIYFPTMLPSEIMSGFPLEPDSQLPDKWKDSDELMTILKNYQDYSDFLKQFGGTELLMLGLGINRMNTLLKYNEPYWAGIFRGKTDTTATITCFVHSTTSETLCLKFVSVDYDDFSNSNVNLYPNPASN